jgi:hypothetical protein
MLDVLHDTMVWNGGVAVVGRGFLGSFGFHVALLITSSFFVLFIPLTHYNHVLTNDYSNIIRIHFFF